MTIKQLFRNAQPECQLSLATVVRIITPVVEITSTGIQFEREGITRYYPDTDIILYRKTPSIYLRQNARRGTIWSCYVLSETNERDVSPEKLSGYIRTSRKIKTARNWWFYEKTIIRSTSIISYVVVFFFRFHGETQWTPWTIAACFITYRYCGVAYCNII